MVSPSSGAPFVVVGEALVDVVVPATGEVTEAVGGSPMNVAVGLSRLDLATLLVTRVGDDAHGLAVAAHVEASGVVLSASSVVPGLRTSTATARLDEHHAASYDFDLVWDLPSQPLPEARGLHVGSLGASLEPGRHAVVDLVREASERGLFVSYDPNVRPAFVTDTAPAWRDLAEIAAMSRLVKVSDEDLHVLRPGEAVDVLAAELLGAEATELVIVTRGAHGALGVSDRGPVQVDAPPVTVVDTVGAGDSFMAATLAILVDDGVVDGGVGAVAALDEAGVARLLGGAVTAAAVTCSRRGANPPTRRELPAPWPR